MKIFLFFEEFLCVTVVILLWKCRAFPCRTQRKTHSNSNKFEAVCYGGINFV